MNSLIQIALLVIVCFACASMAHPHDSWSLWWCVWQVPLWIGSFWAGRITGHLLADYRAESGAEAQEQIDEMEEIRERQLYSVVANKRRQRFNEQP